MWHSNVVITIFLGQKNRAATTLDKLLSRKGPKWLVLHRNLSVNLIYIQNYPTYLCYWTMCSSYVVISIIYCHINRAVITFWWVRWWEKTRVFKWDANRATLKHNVAAVFHSVLVVPYQITALIIEPLSRRHIQQFDTEYIQEWGIQGVLNGPDTAVFITGIGFLLVRGLVRCWWYYHYYLCEVVKLTGLVHLQRKA